MEKNQLFQHITCNLQRLSLPELRQRWEEAWGIPPHARIGRTMLLESLAHKIREQEVGGLPQEQKSRLDQLIYGYKRNPDCFDQNRIEIKPGTRLIKIWSGERHTVIVLPRGYEYKNKVYGSLSEIASVITGVRRNGWVFFDLKNKRRSAP